MRTRIALGAAGLALLGFGVFRILTNTNLTNPRQLARWLIGSVIINDGVLVPTSLVIGYLLTKLCAPRVRRYLQGAFIAAAMITVVAIPLIYRRGSQPAVKALEQQDYGLHLAFLIGMVFAGAALAYLARVVLDHRRGATPNASNLRPSALQDSDGAKPAASA